MSALIVAVVLGALCVGCKGEAAPDRPAPEAPSTGQPEAEPEPEPEPPAESEAESESGSESGSGSESEPVAKVERAPEDPRERPPQVKAALALLTKWRDHLCSCATAECATEGMLAFARETARIRDPAAAAASRADRKLMEALAREMTGCAQRLQSAD